MNTQDTGAQNVLGVVQESTVEAKSKPIRVLALCDSPTSATGFAQVSRNVLKYLATTGKYEIDVIGINYMGDYYDRAVFPYNIYPAQPQGYSDMFGRGRVLNALNGVEEKYGLRPPWDIVFTIQDSFVIEGLGLTVPFAEQVKVNMELWKRMVPPEAWFTWIGYFPVDSDLKENWVTRSIALADFPVAYCEWGKQKMLEHDREKFETSFTLNLPAEKGGKQKAKMYSRPLADRVSVIHHGVDTQVFKPLPAEEIAAFRKDYFNGAVTEDTYLVINVSRNQPRKDMARTFAVFAAFKTKVPKAHLYVHCRPEDIGGSISEIARAYKLQPGVDYSVPHDFDAGVGYPVEIVNKIYNAADLCITTTLGEGWGFITTEAMATKTPIVAPYITSIIDIFGGDQNGSNQLYNLKMIEDDQTLRGIPVTAGSNSSEFFCMGLDDNERIRPLTNVDDMVEKMVWAYHHRDYVQKIVDRGFAWVQQLTWDAIGKQWDEVFTKAYAQLVEKRKVGINLNTVNRNDPCPCGSGVKFKKCHGSPDKFDKFQDWVVGN